jgi:hypothetical protein
MSNVLKLFRRIKSDDQDLMKVQVAVEQVVNPIARVALLGGQTITVTLSAGTNKIQHKLGVTPSGWFVTDTTSAVTIYRTAWDQNFLTLNASGACTVDMWVYP